MADHIDFALVLRGCAALVEMLDCIGSLENGDQTVAKILVENEMEIREVLDIASYTTHENITKLTS